MELNKRECNISIELKPVGCDFLNVIWCIGEDCHVFKASSAMGYQFSAFVEAVYQLYSEGYDSHSHNHRTDHEANFTILEKGTSSGENIVIAKTIFHLDEEGPCYTITLERKCKHWNNPIIHGEDPIEISINSIGSEPYTYTVDGRDLCYAMAKAYTDVIKKHGFYGYYLSTGGNCNGFGDVIDIHMILFIKAYALCQRQKLLTQKGCGHFLGPYILQCPHPRV